MTNLEDVPELIDSDFAADVLEFYRLQGKLRPIVAKHESITVFEFSIGFSDISRPWRGVVVNDDSIPF